MFTDTVIIFEIVKWIVGKTVKNTYRVKIVNLINKWKYGLFLSKTNNTQLKPKYFILANKKKIN